MKQSCNESFKFQMHLIRNSNDTFSEQDSLSKQAKEFIDNITVRVSSSFTFTWNLLLHELFEREKLSLYKNSFLKSLVGSVKAAYSFMNSEI